MRGSVVPKVINTGGFAILKFAFFLFVGLCGWCANSTKYRTL